jgi:hypothetical protein
MANPSVRFQFDDKQIADLRRVLSPAQVKQACFQAVTRTTNKAKAICAEAVLSQFTVARKYVVGTNRRAAVTSKVTRGDVPEGIVTIKSVPLPFTAFKVQDARPFGVYVTLDKARPPLHFRHAFLATVASRAQSDQGVSHRGVFVRTKARDPKKATPRGISWRLPMKELQGPSVLSRINVPATRAEVLAKVGNELAKQLDSQVSRFTDGRFATLSDATTALDAAGSLLP